jgi:putative FmdB family regulatory protein
MPLYEYQCQHCRHHFELLVRESTDFTCPQCGSTELARQLSVFAVGVASPRGASADGGPAPCPACGDPRGPGSCGSS